MVKTERIEAEEGNPRPASAWLTGAAAWFIPGLGHVLQKRWWRAAPDGWRCLDLFLCWHGNGRTPVRLAAEGSSALLQVPPMIANLGTGALYLVSWLLDYGFKDDPAQAARATYEYGNTFLLIAGLLNYLTMLDAFDIAAGRKP